MLQTRESNNTHRTWWCRSELWRQVLEGWPHTFSKCSMRISTTMFWNLIFIIAATVSSWARMRVGPNITPMLDGDIKFSLLCSHTLMEGKKKNTPERDRIRKENAKSHLKNSRINSFHFLCIAAADLLPSIVELAIKHVSGYDEYILWPHRLFEGTACWHCCYLISSNLQLLL